jgi:hypothetical protein
LVDQVGLGCFASHIHGANSFSLVALLLPLII